MWGKDVVMYLVVLFFVTDIWYCLGGELYGAINASQWDGSITLEQADFLRKKYLFGDSEEDLEPEEMFGFGLREQE